jgi:L-lysine 2,3-aminomutase
MTTLHGAASFRASRWWSRLRPDDQRVFDVVSRVYAFRVSEHVLETLIDWEAAPDDPLFRQVFPQRGMLTPADFERVSRALGEGRADHEIEAVARDIRAAQNPHPGAQVRNIPLLAGSPLTSVQHKYRETLLFFPAGGQTCHSYCAYCFRWAQFVESGAPRFGGRDVEQLRDYLRGQPLVTDVVLTGGDPAILPTARFAEVVDALLPLARQRTLRLRVATKAPIYHPGRFLQGSEARDLLALFARARDGGLPVNLMLHASHPRELQSAATRAALAALRPVVPSVFLQSPIVRGINDDADTWARLLTLAVDLGCTPYYMFVPRDTGPSRHFAVTLDRALSVYQQALGRVTGLARTLRGPMLSDDDGKLELLGTESGPTGRVFLLRHHQHRDPQRVGQLLRAPYDAQATWVHQASVGATAPA